MHLVGAIDCDGLSDNVVGIAVGLSGVGNMIEGRVGVFVGLTGVGGIILGREGGRVVGTSVGKVVGVNVSTQISGGPRSPKHSLVCLIYFMMRSEVM